MEGGPIDEYLRVAVERLVLDQLKIKVQRALEDRLLRRLTSDNWKDCHLHEVDQTGGHQRSVQRQAAVPAQRNRGGLF